MASNLTFRGVKYIVPVIVASSALDSLLKEQPWVPSQVKQFAFYLLGPIAALGMVLVIPYIRARLEIVFPRRVSNFVLGVVIGISVIAVVTWAIMYYQVTWISTSSINSTALFFKDIVLGSSAVVFALLTVRLARWYGSSRNGFVLLYASFALGDVVFSSLHILPDYLAKPTPLVLIQATAVAFMFLMWTSNGALILLVRAYFERRRLRKWAAFSLVTPHVILATAFMLSVVFQMPLDPTTRTITTLGLAMAGPVYLTGFMLVASAVQNPIAKAYYRGLGYGIGLLAGATCGMGLGVAPIFPLSGFPSLTTLSHGACLAFAAFTSAASYFAISENVRKEIRESKAFITSIGEAENRISVERQVNAFYDKFARMAEASGAVEAAAISKDEIYSYAAAVKGMQRTGSAPTAL